MGFWSSVGSFFSSAASAVADGVKAVAKGAVRAVQAVGSFVVKTTESLVEHIKSRASDWGQILKKTVIGAFKGGVAGYKFGGPWGALVGAIKGGATEGYREWKTQSEAKTEAERTEQNLEESKRAASYEMDSVMDDLTTLIGEIITPLTRIANSTETIDSMQEYVRFDVSLKFVVGLVERIGNISSPAEIADADRRMVKLIHALVVKKSLTDSQLIELDGLIKHIYGETLLLMGAKHLFGLWTAESKSNAEQLEQLRKLRSQMFVKSAELEALDQAEISGGGERATQRASIDGHMEELDRQFEEAKQYKKNLRIITGSAEGLLQNAELENNNKVLRAAEIARHDRAGAIMLNLEREINELREGELPLSREDEQFLTQYSDLYMAGANERKKKEIDISVAG